jgi:hypothetical protein
LAHEFFAVLPEILPLPVNLCFEGVGISPDVQQLLAAHAISASFEIPRGTIWPKSDIFHVVATEQFLVDLTAVARRHAEPEICDHFFAYTNGRGLMQWYDAFDLSLLIAETVPEARLQIFCRKLSARYAPWRFAKA